MVAKVGATLEGNLSMRGLRFGLLLASTAVAVVLAARSIPAYAVAENDKAIEALVPVPDTTNLPPPSAKDVVATAATASPTAESPSVTPSSTTAVPEAAPSTTATGPAAPAAQPASALAE